MTINFHNSVQWWQCGQSRSWTMTIHTSITSGSCKLLTHLPLDKMAAISQTIFSRCIFVNEKFCILIEISVKVFLRVQLTITQHWFRWWLGTDQVTCHYLNKCWPSSLMHICSTRGRWVNLTQQGVWNMSAWAHAEESCYDEKFAVILGTRACLYDNLLRWQWWLIWHRSN